MHIIYINQSHSSLITHTYIYALITFKETPGTALIKKKILICSDWDSELNSLVWAGDMAKHKKLHADPQHTYTKLNVVMHMCGPALESIERQVDHRAHWSARQV